MAHVIICHSHADGATNELIDDLVFRLTMKGVDLVEVVGNLQGRTSVDRADVHVCMLGIGNKYDSMMVSHLRGLVGRGTIFAMLSGDRIVDKRSLVAAGATLIRAYGVPEAERDPIVNDVTDAIDVVRAGKNEAPKEVATEILELVSVVDAPKMLRKIAYDLGDLRLNNPEDFPAQIEAIADYLEGELNSGRRDEVEEASLREEVGKKAMRILVELFEALGSRRGASIIVAGAVAGVLSLGGAPIFAAYGLTLAVFEGPAAFKAVVEKAIGAASSKGE